ncbi:ATP-binding protein [Antrihabitans spumae]|jgi:serine/threonine-protein kinase RsbW|uniref:ATP-binding protein n=1 Tax=Antrihabitans spumae TaxID=3373370 RepID=A0ABW7KIV4_9NOCA
MTDIQPLRCEGFAAEPSSAVAVRGNFHTWLDENFRLDADRSSALTLAVNEALANAVEHAYFDYAMPGTFDLVASYDAANDRLLVTIADHGHWRAPLPDPMHLRGRGIPLMNALAEHAEIEKGVLGTIVSLSWSTRSNNRAAEHLHDTRRHAS